MSDIETEVCDFSVVACVGNGSDSDLIDLDVLTLTYDASDRTLTLVCNDQDSASTLARSSVLLVQLQDRLVSYVLGHVPKYVAPKFAATACVIPIVRAKEHMLVR
jgi:hypothetical protein